MAVYDQLAVFKDAYAVLIFLYSKFKDVPRDVKFTLVEQMKNDFTQVLVLVYKANSTRDKIPHIKKAQEIVELTKMRIRLLHDLHHINKKTYLSAALAVEEVSKQLSGWLKFARGDSKAKSEPLQGDDVLKFEDNENTSSAQE